jgi:hypothetical protein
VYSALTLKAIDRLNPAVIAILLLNLKDHDLYEREPDVATQMNLPELTN